MAPERIAEVRIARRVLLVSYFIVVVGLCLATAVSIVATLAREGNGCAAPAGALQTPPRRALAQLRSLLQELRQRGDTVGRGNPQRFVDLREWAAWTARWRQRLERLGMRYGLSGADVTGAAAQALQRAYRAMFGLLDAYQAAVQSIAQVRRSAVEGVSAELQRAAEALRGGQR
jgi:hypothetical protein